ncbi:alpha/beta fold hydrolase [Clostridium sp. YIM B02551]|uniref:alpha/beta fold hydrolase n=1 Tax=Clostridium sp. YIM B02551 TaxID=2910679 RepID=UPI001EECCB9D|nr:alpha/beta hydrolase [Clostridium sp. YIM B02551]
MNAKTVFKSVQGKNEILKYYDCFIEKIDFSHEIININSCLGNTFIIASGKKEAPPVILFHGSGMNSFMWLKDIKEYSLNYRVYAIDIPGEPGKSNEYQASLNGMDYVSWVNDILNELSIEKSSFVGISLGAWMALKFAVNHPEKVDKLVLISPSGIGPQKRSFIFKALYYSCLGETGVKKLAYKINGNKEIPETILKYQRLITKNFIYRRETIPIFSDNELKRLDMPIALFVGENDIMLHSLKTAKRLSELRPKANINILKDKGHSLTDLVDKIMGVLN